MTEPSEFSKRTFNKKFLFERAWDLRRKYFTRPNKVKNESFHEAIGPILAIGQVFCSMPIGGVLKENPNEIKFTWCSLKILYLIIILVFGSAQAFLIFHQSFKTAFTFRTVEPCLFYLITMMAIVLFLMLGQKWKFLIKYWHDQEDIFLRAPYCVPGMRLKIKIRLYAITYMLLALMEHLIFLSANILFYYKEMHRCDLEYDNFVRFYFVNEHQEIFDRIPYNHFFGLAVKWTNLVLTFAWSWTDIFIVCISFGITMRFDQLSHRIRVSYDKAKTSIFWMEIRIHYTQIMKLLFVVDKEIAYLIILSCASNLYYICYKLFNSFVEIPDPFNKFYFWFSLLFLLVRTLSVLMAAAIVNDASKAPLKIIRDIPTNSWNFELRRFSELLTDDYVALSGKRFFYLTRRTVLAMIGTVMTYEIVLLDQLQGTNVPTNSTCSNLSRFTL